MQKMNGYFNWDSFASNYYCTAVIITVITVAKFSYSLQNHRYPYDYLCNNGTKFACVCYRDDSLTPYFNVCDRFLGVKQLPVVKAILKEVNLTDQVRFNDAHENYEDYFKRRVVAKILDRYCRKNLTNCEGTSLPITAQRVVVLTVECGSRDGESVIRYVVAQNSSQNDFTPNNIMDQEKVIRVINETLMKKPNLLGLAKMIKHQPDILTVDTFFKPPSVKTDPNEPFTKFLETTTGTSNEDNDYFVRNMAFFIIIIVLGVIVAIIYIIAIIKAVSDRHKQLNRMKELEKKNDQPTSYGATGANSPQQLGTKTVLSSCSLSKQIQIPETVSKYSDLNEPIIDNSDKQNLHTNNLMTPTSAYVRVLINQPPPPFISLTSFLRKSKKCSSNENLISQSCENSPNFVKKSKTIHEIRHKNEHDNEVCEELLRHEFDENSLLKFCETPEVNAKSFYAGETAEIRIEITESSPNNEEADDFYTEEHDGKWQNDKIPEEFEEQLLFEGGFAVDGCKEAGALLTTSQTEENLLSDVSSLNEFSTESDEDSDLTSDYNNYQKNQPIASYKQLKESVWSINKDAASEEDVDIL